MKLSVNWYYSLIFKIKMKDYFNNSLTTTPLKLTKTNDRLTYSYLCASLRLAVNSIGLFITLGVTK